MIEQPSAIGFRGTLKEILTHYQKVFCREHGIDESKHAYVESLVSGVKLRYIECLGPYPPYAFNESAIGSVFGLYNSTSGPQMICNTGGHYNPDEHYIFEIIKDKG